MPDPAENDFIEYSQGAGAHLDRTVVIALVVLFMVGLYFRASNLNAIGFAEDEVNKVDAIRQYEKGDITANGEHPMLMKGMMFVTVKVGRALTSWADEVLFRLPNAFFGALTLLPLFLLTAAFFDRWTGLLAAAFWTVGLNAISINRVGKEDTLLVFFLLFAFYFYLRAKQTDTREVKSRSRHYLLSGISFGLMFASKYFPHYIGLNALYHHHFSVRKRMHGEPSGKTSLIFYVALVVAFLIANPAVLMPSVWEYMNSYMSEKLLTHTGYVFAGEIYKNTVSSTPFWGTPIYFYILFMAIKIPLLVLLAFLAGLVLSIRNWRHPGHAFVLFMFLFWIVPYSVMGAKWLRYTLSLMPFVYMFAAIGVAGLLKLAITRFKLPEPTRTVFAAVAALVFVGFPAWSAYSASPHYALYVNTLGAGKAGYFYPHDEIYDDGLREAIKFVSDHASSGATLAHETPAATRYYLERFGRQDLQSKPISAKDFDPAKIDGPAYMIIQPGRTYFENRDKLAFIRSNFQKVHQVTIRGTPAAEIFINPAARLGG